MTPAGDALARALRALARLLDYPSEPLLASLGEVGVALAAAPAPAARRAALEPLLERLAGSELLEAQERYVDTFERGRRTSLHLFEHVHGESRDRGQAMVDLLARYRAAGIEPVSEQLPDYLPAFLEYLSLLDPREARAQLAEVAHLLGAIGGVLAARGSDYAGAFDLLLALAGEAALEPGEAGEDDRSCAALDEAWIDAPVRFIGADPACAGSGRFPLEQTIQLQRRSP